MAATGFLSKDDGFTHGHFELKDECAGRVSRFDVSSGHLTQNLGYRHCGIGPA